MNKTRIIIIVSYIIALFVIVIYVKKQFSDNDASDNDTKNPKTISALVKGDLANTVFSQNSIKVESDKALLVWVSERQIVEEKYVKQNLLDPRQILVFSINGKEEKWRLSSAEEKTVFAVEKSCAYHVNIDLFSYNPLASYYSRQRDKKEQNRYKHKPLTIMYQIIDRDQASEYAQPVKLETRQETWLPEEILPDSPPPDWKKKQKEAIKDLFDSIPKTEMPLLEDIEKGIDKWKRMLL